jgi:hypothetical protein
MAARYVFACAILTLGLAACSTPPEPAHVLTPFSDDDFRFWSGGGDASIEGQANATLADGRKVSCAGQTVLLLPATAYNTELEQLLEKGKRIPDDYSRRARAYQRRTICDADGRFSFSNLPPLRWIVVSRANWEETITLYVLTEYIPWWSEEATDRTGGYFFLDKKLEHGRNKAVLTAEDFVKDAD